MAEETKETKVEVTFRLSLVIEMSNKPEFIAYTFVTITDVPKEIAENDDLITNTIGKQAAMNFKEGLQNKGFCYLSYDADVTKDMPMHLVNMDHVNIITVEKIEKL